MLPSPTQQTIPSLTASTPIAALAGELQLRAIIVSAVVLAIALAANHLIALGMARALERQKVHGHFAPETRTRMMIIRRILSAGIWLIAIGFAMSQFAELRVLSAGLLASAGVSGLVVGFAARNTLGNAVAGVIIAFSQPIRIGDDVEFKGDRGIVEDITLFFTVLRLGDGKRLVVPNDILSNDVIKNLTMGDVTRIARVEILVPPRGDAPGLRRVLLELSLQDAGLDPQAAPPEVYWVRIDERGTLIRLVATCADGASADRLGQRAFSAAAERVFQFPPDRGLLPPG